MQVFSISKSDLRKLVQAMSFFDPHNIREYILEENPAARTWPGYPSTSLEYHNARTELIQRSLIIRQKDENTITIHRLIQDVVWREFPLQPRLDVHISN